ncbi:MAG: mechanosensitive ion channel family protein, partial [Pseudomonadota bacterium]
MTELKTPQNVLRHVPNSAIFGNVISSYNAFPEMRVDLEVGISYDADIAAAREIMLRVVAADDRFLQTPAPQVITKALADSSVNLEIRAWVAQADFFATRFDLTRDVKLALDNAGISIPYPHRQLVFPPESQPVAAPRKRKPRTTKRAPAKSD